MAVVLKSGESTGKLTIENASLAARVTPRGFDYTGLGIFSIASASGSSGGTLMSAGLAAQAVVYEFPWSDSSNLCLLRSVSVYAGSVTAFTAGVARFALAIVREQANLTTGGVSLLTGRNQQLRSSMSPSRITWTRPITPGRVRIADGGILGGTGGGVTDSNSIGATVASVAGVAGEVIVPPTMIFDGFYMPVLLQTGEAVIITATVPATGTWKFGVNVVWAEMSVANIG